jgi:hypothetical protein
VVACARKEINKGLERETRYEKGERTIYKIAKITIKTDTRDRD